MMTLTTILLLLAFFPTVTGAAHTALDDSVATINLEEFGWTPAPPVLRGEFEPASSGQQLAFDSTGRLVVGFASKRETGLVTREHPALSYNVIRFAYDVRGGSWKPEATWRLGTDNWRRNSLVLTPDDNIIVRANDWIQIQSNGNWEKLSACDIHCALLQSPSRRTLLIDPRGWQSEARVFDFVADNKTPIACKNNRQPYHSITDSTAWFSGETVANGVRQNRLYSWPLCDPTKSEFVSIDFAGRASALNDDRVLITKAGSILSANRQGGVERTYVLPKGDIVGSLIREGAKGDRFGVVISTYKGGIAALDVPSKLERRRVVVYETSSGKVLATVPLGTRENDTYDFTLSADGRMVAAVLNGVITVRDIPSAEARP